MNSNAASLLEELRSGMQALRQQLAQIAVSEPRRSRRSTRHSARHSSQVSERDEAPVGDFHLLCQSFEALTNKFQEFEQILQSSGGVVPTTQEAVARQLPSAKPSPPHRVASPRNAPTTTPAAGQTGATATINAAPPASSPSAIGQPPREQNIVAPALPAPATPDGPTVYANPAGERFKLTLDQMGKALPGHLAGFAQDPAFRGVVKIQTPPFDWQKLRRRIPQPGESECRYVQWGKSKVHGISRLLIAPSELPEWQLPELSQVNRPSYDEAWAFLEEAALNPPQEPIPYYVGPSLLPAFDSLLYPGDQLCGLREIPGANTTYWHFGKRMSGTATHDEDADWRSSNAIIGPGYKIWLVIDKKDNHKYLEFLSRHWNLSPCDQCVRHLNLITGPETLKREGIGFQIHCLGEGEMFVTQPKQYHYVVNYSSCLAIAINHLHPGEPTFPTTVRVCKDCGLFPLDHSSLEKVSSTESGSGDVDSDGGLDSPRASSQAGKKRKRPGHLKLSAGRPKRSRQDASPRRAAQGRVQSKAVSELDTVKREVLKFDPLCNVPDYASLPRPDLLRYACAVRGRAAVDQLRSLIERQRDVHSFRLTAPDDQTECLIAIRHGTGTTLLAKLYERLRKYQLFDLVDHRKGGRTRADPQECRVAQAAANCAPRTYFSWKTEGRIWSAFRGLLFLVPFQKQEPFGFSGKEYINLKDSDRDVLHALLVGQYMTTLCSVACAFFDSLQIGSRPVEFLWETTDIDLLTCDEEEMLRYLQPLPFTDVNIWEPTRFLEKPGAWPEDRPWPADPTTLLPDEKQCDYCNDDRCVCSNEVDVAPQIKTYPEGRGLQASACAAGAVAYDADGFIGIVTGELFPLGTFKDENWTFNLQRPDLEGCPAVCQVRMTTVSNSFRLLTASQYPTARLLPRRRAGRWVLAVEALREIQDNEQLTVVSLPWSRSDVTHGPQPHRNALVARALSQ